MLGSGALNGYELNKLLWVGGCIKVFVIGMVMGVGGVTEKGRERA